MPKYSYVLFIIAFALRLYSIIAERIYERRTMRLFFERGCAGFRWCRRFPLESKTEIREFLDVFIKAFGYQKKRRLYFAPDDKIMEFYRIRYLPNCLIDCMELEDLVTGLRKKYGVDVLGTWREDITLGDLFTLTRGTRVYV